MVKLIPLTQGQFAIVDETDFEWLSQWKWQALWSRSSKSFYARRSASFQGEQKVIYMAREILGNPIGLQVDHSNHDTLDNRRSNLRAATVSQNQFNRGLSARSTSGHKGVTWSKRRSRWISRIELNGHRRYLGMFSDLSAAATAYRDAASAAAGEFAFVGVR
jgi:hypothetical protein